MFREWNLVHETTDINAREFIDREVQTGTNYYYYVSAFNSSGLQSSPFLNRTESDHPEQAVSPGRETGDFARVYFKEIDTHGELDNIVKQLTQTWQNGAWVNQTEENFSYSYAGSDSGLQTGYLRRRWYNNAWSNSKKIEFQYND
ncbi:MAG: hypothetical protein GWP06_09850, partial [Actinobacteria bacterium]|nr:hypothetical protein [Actinomycetota bacterium]